MGSALGVPFRRVAIALDEPAVDDVAARTDEVLRSCGLVLTAGTEVAIALGSRGIVDLQLIVRRVVAWVRSHGASPFVVSAMGSHGGATAEGQREVLASYGLAEHALGCPVRTSMDVVALTAEVGGVAVVTDAEAARAAATIVVNRVKPHTDFHGPYESGLMKMIAIGLGNQVQAERIHAYGAAGLRTLMPEIATLVIAESNVVLGVAIIENALEQVMAVEAIPAARIAAAEPGLLELARAHMPRLPVDALDVLLVDQMGKDISGVGMDTNVIGRTMILGEPDPERPSIRMIGCHRLTPASHGNACGMGLADVVPQVFVDAVDEEVTRTNIVTSGFLLPRQAARRGRRRSSRVGALRARRGCHRPERRARRAHRRHVALRRPVGERSGVGRAAGPRRRVAGDGGTQPARRGRRTAALPLVTVLVVAADDRTGAMETAGASADLGCVAVVALHPATGERAECVVVDLASRHLSADEAGVRAAGVDESAAHKIDSTLRGNWAHELVARHRASGRPVLVVPAFPSAGRTCEGGAVLVDGQPLDCRPDEQLRAAGAASIDALTPGTVMEWLRRPRASFAVCDAETDADLGVVGRAWAEHRQVIVAGTAATVAAVARAVLPAGARPARPACEPPFLIVCGSRHPTAVAQADAAEAAALTVLRPDPEARDDSLAVAAELGARTRAALAEHGFRTIVVVGGDTAAAVLGDAVVHVGGTVAPGVAWSRPWGDDGPLVLTKPGGFGSPSALVDLLVGTAT